ncbi:MAG: zinc ABC transporter substrate-binding protein [Candidatus Rhabdochlamydia sp.]
MKCWIVPICYAGIILLLAGCNQPVSKLSEWKAPSHHLKVLCTNALIHDLVSQVGKERIKSLSLIEPSIDPHSYEMRKGDEEKFLCAQLVFYNGLGLEHNPSLSAHLTSHPHAYALGSFIQDQDPSLILEDKGQVDPHIWLDTLLWSYTVDLIVTQLGVLDPEGKPYYEAQGADVKASLMRLHQQMTQALDRISVEKKYLVSSHDAFNYFARRYLTTGAQDDWQDHFCAPEGLAPDGQLSFYDLKRVVNYIHDHRITTVFSETNVSQDSLRKIVDICASHHTCVQIFSLHLLSDTLGEYTSYEAMMKHNLDVLCQAWGGA